MRIPGKTRSIQMLAGLALGALAMPASALTVTGHVQERSREHVVVGETHFLVDSQTRVRQSPGSNEASLPYRPALLEDAYKVRVSGAGRKAERIVILPYGYDREAGQ